jgi:glutathione S-transferase
MSFKVLYFPLPGRAEVARLLCHTATKKIEWKDERLEFASWAEGPMKAKTSFGQLPCLELPDGTFLAQSSAIDRFLAVKTGAEPKDELAWARSDEVYAYMEDVWQVLAPTMRIQDADEKLKARAAAVAPLKEKLAILDKHVGKLADGAWFSGLDRPSYADYSVYNWLSTLCSGWLDGIPEDVIAGFPNLVAFRKRVLELPGVQSWYALPENQDDMRKKSTRAL